MIRANYGGTDCDNAETGASDPRLRRVHPDNFEEWTELLVVVAHIPSNCDHQRCSWNPVRGEWLLCDQTVTDKVFEAIVEAILNTFDYCDHPNCIAFLHFDGCKPEYIKWLIRMHAIQRGCTPHYLQGSGPDYVIIHIGSTIDSRGVVSEVSDSHGLVPSGRSLWEVIFELAFPRISSGMHSEDTSFQSVSESPGRQGAIECMCDNCEISF